jgi:hypothetical protein
MARWSALILAVGYSDWCSFRCRRIASQNLLLPHVLGKTQITNEMHLTLAMPLVTSFRMCGAVLPLLPTTS